MSDGSQMLNIDTPRLPVNIDRASTETQQLTEAIGQRIENANSKAQSSARNLGSTYRDMMDLSTAISQSDSTGNSAKSGVSIDQAQAINKNAQIVKELANSTGISDTKAAEIIGMASIGFGAGQNYASTQYKNSLNAQEQKAFNEAEKMQQDKGYQETIRQAATAAKEISQTATDDKVKRLSDGVSGSYELSMSQRKEASDSFREAEDYSKQRSYVQANSATINMNANQQFVDWLANQPMPNTKGRIGMDHVKYMLVQQPGLVASYAQEFQRTSGFVQKSPEITSAKADLQAKYDQGNAHETHQVSREPLEKVKEQAGNMTARVKAEEVRANVERDLSTAQTAIRQESGKIIEQSKNIEKQVKENQDKGVNRRVFDKGIKEIEDVFASDSKAGEPQQK
jgi:hypothetical protein